MAGRHNSKDLIAALENSLGHEFKDKTLGLRALTHPSMEGEANYQRLEFLGDRVLGVIIAAHLYDNFEGESEGGLSRRLAALVRKETLGAVARDLNLGPLIRMAETAGRAGGRENPSILADVLEAALGAIYVDGGFEAARRFVEKVWGPHLTVKTAAKDPKSGLQEWTQAKGLGLPEYQTKERSGPDHAPSFTIEVSVKGLGSAEATGASKRLAETRAAEKLLAKARAKP